MYLFSKLFSRKVNSMCINIRRVYINKKVEIVYFSKNQFSKLTYRSSRYRVSLHLLVFDLFNMQKLFIRKKNVSIYRCHHQHLKLSGLFTITLNKWRMDLPRRSKLHCDKQVQVFVRRNHQVRPAATGDSGEKGPWARKRDPLCKEAIGKYQNRRVTF